MSEENKNQKTNKKRTPSFVSVLARMFLGGRSEKVMTVENERYDSPTKLAVKRFFRKPLALSAVILLASMFIFVLVGPLFAPIDLSYTESMHTNIAPNMSMMKLPAEMKDSPRVISSRGSFTLGVDKNGKTHIWGYYYSPSPEKDVMNIPPEVLNANIVHAAAGIDHCIAIGDDSTVYCWGNYENGQYGDQGIMAMACEYLQPDFAALKASGAFDVKNVKQVLCGNQVSAILMEDGTIYPWGNNMSGADNVSSIVKAARQGAVYDKICFTNTSMFAITKDGEFVSGKNKQYEYIDSVPTVEVIAGRKIVDIAATGDSLSFVFEDGSLLSLGTINKAPALEDGDKALHISGGSRHFTLLTESGKVLSWGNGKLGQTKVPSSLQEEGSAAHVIASGFQNYAFDENGKHIDSWGLKGYLMGTDESGRDVFNRVMNGGRMTMTIGAVAVIVSSIIGIIIGCISGYFGGLVDLLLMRVTEVFAAIPFLPFALVLSAVLQGSSLKEDYRIFIIMIILGLLSWTGLAQLVRGQILAEREKEFVIAARSMGIKEKRIAFKHILPNIISVILVNLTLNFASCMLTESSLSYLGFGVRLPRPTWGNMLDGCRNALVIQNYWWRWLFPALFLAVTVICINIIGDTLRDVLDPKSEVEK